MAPRVALVQPIRVAGAIPPLAGAQCRAKRRSWAGNSARLRIDAWLDLAIAFSGGGEGSLLDRYRRAAFLCAVCVLPIGCGHSENGNEANVAAPPAVVRVTTLRRETVPITEDFQGTIGAIESVEYELACRARWNERRSRKATRPQGRPHFPGSAERIRRGAAYGAGAARDGSRAGSEA